MEREWQDKFGLLHCFDPISGLTFRIEVVIANHSGGQKRAELCMFGPTGWCGVFQATLTNEDKAVEMCKEYLEFIFPPMEGEFVELPGEVIEL